MEAMLEPELYCQICGVTTDFARLRMEHEPLEAGWSCGGDQVYTHDQDSCLMKPKETGCKLTDIPVHPGQLHIPGPGCTSTGGYHGHRIGEREMENMREFQLLVLKSGPMPPEPDAPEYERESRYFVARPSIDLPVNDDQSEVGWNKYGIAEMALLPLDNPTQFESLRRIGISPGIVVHISCWTIFTKVSLLRSGHVDIDNFCELWMECGFGKRRGFEFISPEKDVRANWSERWLHQIGTEYLAADPCYAPSLIPALCQQIYYRPIQHDAAYDESMLVADSTNSFDLFCTLPRDLHYLLLDKLSSKDIANLRLASRAFVQLPNSIVKKKVKEDFPWFYEIDDFDRAARNRSSPPSRPNPKNIAYAPAWILVPSILRALASSELGLRNRVRIWHRCSQILDHVVSLRKQAEQRIRDRITEITARLAAEGY